MKKSERLLYILSLLRTRKRLRAKDLAAKCEVTERTIYRDICSISGSNIPIFFDDGYKLIHEEFMPPMSFTPAESAFLINFLRTGVAKPSKSHMIERIIDKLEASLKRQKMSDSTRNVSNSSLNRIKISKY
jgi:predicted DNA-binding transcriptional regulator YafY